MKKLITTLFCGFLCTTAFGQWSKTSMKGQELRSNVDQKGYYSLDLNAIRDQLKNAPEQAPGVKPVIVNVPTLDGKVERFAVYSFPVMERSLAEKYQLGSYVGKGLDDPAKYIRFSVSPYDFQSMIIKNGRMEFVEPANEGKTVYGVHPKTNKTAGDAGTWMCTSKEDSVPKKEISSLLENGKAANSNVMQNRASDRKYRTLRLAMSTTGEYTQYFGGRPQALAQVNATLTRCNGVFETDFGLHLILQDYPDLIFLDPSSDPYSPAGQMSNWNVQLQQTLTSMVGNDNYDIGHLFGASGGGGNAGCIGCVCVNPTGSNSKAKGSGITSPADNQPFGDNFDIDYVAHEMGHQLGANHTFSFSLEGTGQNVEPGSGSTIMGYAGITGATDLQPHSDPYFHINSIIQVQNNLASKTCDIETPVANQPPVVTPMPDVTIPKTTAFVLTAQATDPEGDPITYTWEQTDNATQTTNKNNLGTLTSGPTFRSWTGTSAPERYFPKLATVLSGTVKNADEWEAVPVVARTLNFKVTVRDFNADPAQQQTAYGTQKVTVGSDGPFKVTSEKVYNNNAAPLTWDVVNTNAAPYNVSNVKIDYSTDNGATWTTVAGSTPNDGTENLIFAGLTEGSEVFVRVSALDNVFYAVKKVLVSQVVNCDGSAPVGIVVSNITQTSATVSWESVSGATYTFRYRKQGTTTWTDIATATPAVNLSGLEESATYEYQVAAICSGVTGSYSAIKEFQTAMLAYCTLTATSSTTFEYISNVTVTPANGTAMSNNSGPSLYTDYTTDPAKLITLTKGASNNQISVSKAWTGTQFSEAVKVWIDFNRDGSFGNDEVVLSSSLSTATPVTATFAVPATAYSGPKPLRMRVAMRDNNTIPNCGSYTYGEVEDYAVIINDSSLGTVEAAGEKGLQVYPNPAKEVLNISTISRNASYTIHNAPGQVVAKGEIKDGKVRLSGLTAGVYVISINENGTVTTKKFIKE